MQSFLTGKDTFRRFIENLPVLFYAVSPVPPYTPFYVSPAFERYGYTVEEWLSDPNIWMRVIHKDDLEWVFSKSTASTDTGEEVDYEYRIIDAKGEMHWVQDRACLIRDAEGRVIGREGVMLDITARKSTEEALTQSEQRYRNLFENANDIIYVHDLSGNYISMNKSAERVFGYTTEEAMKLNMSQIAAPEQIDIVRKQLSKKVEGSTKQTGYELECLRKDGTKLTLEVNSTLIYKDDVPVAVQGIARDVTERKLAEEAIRESENQYRDLFENANDLIYTHDMKGNFTSLNRAGERMTGYSRDEALTMNIAQVVDPRSLSAARQMTQKKLAQESSTTYEIDIMSRDGSHVALELSTRLIYRQGVAVGVQGVGRDVTERRRSEEALRASEHRYRQLGEGISHQVWTATETGQIDYVNARMLEYFQRTLEEMIGMQWFTAVHPDDVDECTKRWANSFMSGDFFEVEFRLLRHDGVYRWHQARATCGRDATGNIVQWYGTNTDVDDQKQSEEKLNYFARHDTLTDLPNRSEFMIHLSSAIERAGANPESRFAVLFLDLDRFKVINDSLGHSIGDKLLRCIADRLRQYVRPGDVVARLGGDEFTILLNRTGGMPDVIQIAERLQRNLALPFQIDSYEVVTSASIGIIASDDISRQPEDFLRDADAAMYRAKEAGKARYEVFDGEMHVQNLNLLKLETDLRHAVEKNEFEVHYQPIIDIVSGTHTEFEALLRWRHPVRGLVAPDVFIELAEETGLIIPIGKWIIENACRQISEWQRYSEEKLSISVNLSAKQLMHPSLVGYIKQILQETSLGPGQLKLEVTESSVMEHSERSLKVLSDLDQMGVSLSTDDFGTGYSGLSYLQQFPFKRLKIDRSFIDRMGQDVKSAAIVKTILMLGENLEIEVVAEGIETEQQLASLQMLGCRLGQGFLFSKPVEAAEALKILQQGIKIKNAEGIANLPSSTPILEVSKIQ